MGSTEVGTWLDLFSKHTDLTAAGIGLVLSWFATQFLKGMIKDEVPVIQYRRIVRAVGFVTGWFFAFGAWVVVDPTATRFENFFFSIGVGFASPGLYSIVIPLLKAKFPILEKLSGRPDEPPKPG